MSAVTSLHGPQPLPLRPLRAALLAFIGALVLVEVGSGLVAGAAWRQQSSGALSSVRREDLHQVLSNLATLERFIVGGMIAVTIVWALTALHNATLVAHGSITNGGIAVAALFAGPLLFVIARAAAPADGIARLVNIAVQALALYVPFWGLGRVADGIGGQKLTFFRWYLALGASFAVHELFIAQVDVLSPSGSDELGRTTMMFVINALVVSVMGVMAAEATRSLDRSTSERTMQRQLLRNDASMRTRTSGSPSEGGATLPPPTPSGTPVVPPPFAAGGVAVLDAPTLAPAAAPKLAASPAATATLAPPSSAPVIAGPADGAMPLPTLAAVTPPTLEPAVVTPATAIPVVVVDAQPEAVEPLQLVDTVEPMVEPVLVEPVVLEPVVVASVSLPPPVPSPLPPPPPGARSSMPKLLTITEMRPIPVIEPDPALEDELIDDPEPEAEVVEETSQVVSGFSSMFQPLTVRKP